MPLQPIVVRAPGFGGLNLEGEQISNSPVYAKVAKNLVFDNAGRLASRQGYTNANDLSGTDRVDAIFMFDSTGGNSVVSATADHIYIGTTDRQGSLTHTTAHWQFQNYSATTNGEMIVGAQQGQALIFSDGSTDFAAITAATGTIPSGNCCHVAFGRIWATDTNGVTLQYSGLLDETDWGTDGGTLNIRSNEAAVRDGFDKITAINHIQDKLVVFLENSIVILDGPEDPNNNLSIFKTIDNIGCIARDSVQAIGNDLIFLSRDGLRSLARADKDDNLPLRDLSRHVRSDLIAAVSGSPERVKSAYFNDEGMYILLFTDDIAWVFDFKRIFEDPLPRVTTWEVPKWHSLYYHEGTLYIGQEGEYGTYSGYQEDGATYQVEYKSINVDFDSPSLKMLKKTVAALSGADAQSVTFTYEWDYGSSSNQATVSLPADSGASVYGTGTYGTAIYGDGISRANVTVNPFGSGEILAFGLTTFVENIKFTVEQISHFARIGRTAHG